LSQSIAAENTLERRVRSIVLTALLAGAAVNLAAGVRRPTTERAILASNYYPPAQSAADAIRRLVPATARLAVVGYTNDVVEEVEIPVWIDYRLKWLLYPRVFTAYRVAADGSMERRIGYHTRNPAFTLATDLGDAEYALSFRISAPPPLPTGRWKVIAQDRGFLLARRSPQ
jgi:hypothetical protein